MRLLILTSAILLQFATLVQAQNQSHPQNPAPSDTTHAMLMPDSNTLYLDVDAHPITGQQFSNLIAAGHSTYMPVVEGGKVKSMQLVKVNGDLQLGAKAPDFSMKDINGKLYRLQDLQGKIVVLNLWFTACMPCRLEMPELNRLMEKYKSNDNIIFLAMTFDDAETVKKFLTTNSFQYAILPDQSDVITRFGISSFPTNAIIDKSGKVSFLLSGYSPDNIQKLDTAIGMILNPLAMLN